MLNKKAAKEMTNIANNGSLEDKEVVRWVSSIDQFILKNAAEGRTSATIEIDGQKSQFCNALAAFYHKRGFGTRIDLTHDDSDFLLTIMWGF